MSRDHLMPEDVAHWNEDFDCSVQPWKCCGCKQLCGVKRDKHNFEVSSCCGRSTYWIDDANEPSNAVLIMATESRKAAERGELTTACDLLKSAIAARSWA